MLTQYFSEIAQETGKYAFGVKDTLQALELGSAEELIVWEQLDVNRIVLKHKETGVEKVVYLTERQEKVNHTTHKRRTSSHTNVAHTVLRPIDGSQRRMCECSPV